MHRTSELYPERRPKSQSHNVGFSLVELMVVVGIMLALASLLFAGLASARRRGALSVDLSHMKQIGLAATLYLGDHGEPPLSTYLLTKSGYLDEPTLESSLDKEAVGFANAANKEYNKIRSSVRPVQTDYRDSFVDIELLGLVSVYRRNPEGFQSLPGSGWIAAIHQANEDMWDASFLQRGTYHRLLWDSSVQSRRMVPVSYEAGGTSGSSVNTDCWLIDRREGASVIDSAHGRIGMASCRRSHPGGDF